MKVLTLKDGTELEFIDNSSINNLITVVGNFIDVENLRNSLSQDNLSECTFDGTEYKDVLLSKVIANADDYGNVTVVFSTKLSSDVQIETLKKQVQALENENAQLTDKADAADILMGNKEVE